MINFGENKKQAFPVMSKQEVIGTHIRYILWNWLLHSTTLIFVVT